MIKSGFIINADKNTIERDCQYDDKRIEGMFVKVDGQLLPAAYVFPIEHKAVVIELLNQIAASKKAHDALVADIYYKQFMKYR